MTPLNPKDFASDQDPRWCPGCGDYAILAAVRNALAQIGKKREDIVFVSGIGCSSRFPYYMNTYGMHTIHGRAPGVASGLKIHNPQLSVWVITGDGDGLSIGGNHLIHLLRRNIDVNVLLFNNEIYGLTKGQYSPTSKPGIISKSSPDGSLDRSFNPASLAIGAGATFFARTIDTDLKHMQEVFVAAENHRGTSLVEIYQNCIIFNDGTHDLYTNRATRDDYSVRVEHGKPLVFGKDKNKGVIRNNLKPLVANLGENNVTERDCVVYDKTDIHTAHMVGTMRPPTFPVALGVLYEVNEPCYDQQVNGQLEDLRRQKGEGDMQQLLHSGDTWEVN
jgi:2-oxoglutarate/2-oxoacid ferredoxin oxidoreductase subunit beta